MSDAATFREHLDTVFRVNQGADTVALRLADITEGPLAGGGRQFSLFFHGPATVVLQQGTYEFHHDALGPLAIFIVPIVGSNHERIVYQACFTILAPRATV